MADKDRTKRMAEAGRQKVLEMANAPFAVIPGYEDNSLTQAGKSVGESLNRMKGTNTMGGSAGRTESDFQLQRAGERDMRQFGDEDEINAAMGAAMMGSRRFTKKEVRRGYRKIG